MPSQDTKLKILITTDLFTTDTNGVVTSVKNLFDELTANGHDVKILTISNNLHSHKEGAVYYIRSIPLKAVLTPTNSGWTSLELREELAREREAIRQGQGAHSKEQEG